MSGEPELKERYSILNDCSRQRPVYNAARFLLTVMFSLVFSLPSQEVERPIDFFRSSYDQT